MIYDALVIGGGPAGATAALLLARAGWSVVIVEKAEFPRRKVCGEFISATSLPLLHEIGVGDAFLAAAGPEVRRVGLFAGDTVLDAAMPDIAGAAGRWGRALGRERLDPLLLDAAAAAGAVLRQPWSAGKLQRGPDGWRCTIAARDATEELRARAVILANGSWERGPLSVPPPAHRPSDLLAFKAHFRDSTLPLDLMPLLVFPGGYGGMVHTDDGRVSLSCCIRRDRLATIRTVGAPAGAAVFDHIQAHCAGVRAALGPARLDGAWLSAGPIRPGIRERYLEGAFRIGNRAGEAHPIIAEGISMAMQSAWLLAERLIAHGRTQPLALDAAGRAYGADWMRVFAPRLRSAAAFAALASRPRPAALLAAVARRYPSLLTFGARLSGKSRHVMPVAPKATPRRRLANMN